MRAKLRCRVSAGQFSTECAVVVRAASGREFSLFADRDTLTLVRMPDEGQTVDGWVEVDLIRETGPLSLVKLPYSTLESGPYLTVNRGQISIARGSSNSAAVL